jgi:dipeptidyl aminopeptidase/acylaminoacyl peptidase
VLQGANDTNVPRAESDLVVQALRGRGHPVEYRVYEGEGHGFMRRANRIDALERTVAFFVHWLGEPAEASR